MSLEDLRLFIELKRKTDASNYHQAIASYFSNAFGDCVGYNRQAILNLLINLDAQLGIVEYSENPQATLDKIKIDFEKKPSEKQFHHFDIEEVLSCVKWTLIQLLAKDCERMRESGRMFSDYADVAFSNQNLFTPEEEADFYLQLGDALGF